MQANSTTLPALVADPFLAPTLGNTSSWHASPSPILRDAAAAFAAVTSTPSFLDRTVVAAYDLDSVTTVSSLLNEHGVPSLSCLHRAAGRHLQAVLHTTLAHAARSLILPTLTTLATARINLASGWGSAAVLTAHRLLPASFLSDAHFTFYLPLAAKLAGGR